MLRVATPLPCPCAQLHAVEYSVIMKHTENHHTTTGHPAVATQPSDLRLIANQAEQVAQQHGIVELYVFGSAARGELLPDSDIDVIYSLGATGRTYKTAQTIKHDLSTSFGRPVDALNKETLLANARVSRASRLFLRSIAPDLVRIV